MVGRGRAIRRHAVLQRHDVQRDRDAALERRLRPARLAAGRVRIDLLPRLRRNRVPSGARQGWRPVRARPGWWEPAVNLLGCVFFGISAVAGYLVPAKGSILDLAAANWGTAAGAACFLACALATLRTGRTTKSPRFRRVRALEHAVESDVGLVR
jgi:hypothetical protein